MVEGLSKIYYKNKMIYYIDYSVFQPIISSKDKKEKTLLLLKSAGDEWITKPPNSVLSLVNVTSFYFDMDVLNAFKASATRTAPYENKMAIIGVKGLLKTAYNFVIGLTQNSKVKAFGSILDCKRMVD